jgi:hypothetical protein
MSNPFENGYVEPQKTQRYLKFNEEGSYLFRILTPKDKVITYYKGFKENAEENESKVWTAPDNGDGQLPTIPDNIQLKKWSATDPGFKLYWSVVVYNHDTELVQVWDISQKIFKDFLFSIASGKIRTDWSKFDIQVSKKGEKTQTAYNILTGDTEELSNEAKKIIAETKVNLKAMETNNDPFEIKDLEEVELDEAIPDSL